MKSESRAMAVFSVFIRTRSNEVDVRSVLINRLLQSLKNTIFLLKFFWGDFDLGQVYLIGPAQKQTLFIVILACK